MTGFVVVEEAPDVLRPDTLRSRLNTEGCGAEVSFVGLTRETEGEADVLRLEFDAWQDKLTPVLKDLAEQAIQNFGVLGGCDGTSDRFCGTAGAHCRHPRRQPSSKRGLPSLRVVD